MRLRKTAILQVRITPYDLLQRLLRTDIDYYDKIAVGFPHNMLSFKTRS